MVFTPESTLERPRELLKSSPKLQSSNFWAESHLPESLLGASLVWGGLVLVSFDKLDERQNQIFTLLSFKKGLKDICNFSKDTNLVQFSPHKMYNITAKMYQRSKNVVGSFLCAIYKMAHENYFYKSASE